MTEAPVIYDLCESVLEESKGEIDSLIDKVSNSILEKMKSLDIQLITIIDRDGGKCSQNTKENLIIQQRVTTLLKEYLDMSFLFDFSKKELEKTIKKMKEE